MEREWNEREREKGRMDEKERKKKRKRKREREREREREKGESKMMKLKQKQRTQKTAFHDVKIKKIQPDASHKAEAQISTHNLRLKTDAKVINKTRETNVVVST